MAAPIEIDILNASEQDKKILADWFKANEKEEYRKNKLRRKTSKSTKPRSRLYKINDVEFTLTNNVRLYRVDAHTWAAGHDVIKNPTTNQFDLAPEGYVALGDAPRKRRTLAKGGFSSIVMEAAEIKIKENGEIDINILSDDDRRIIKVATTKQSIGVTERTLQNENEMTRKIFKNASLAAGFISEEDGEKKAVIIMPFIEGKSISHYLYASKNAAPSQGSQALNTPRSSSQTPSTPRSLSQTPGTPRSLSQTPTTPTITRTVSQTTLRSTPLRSTPPPSMLQRSKSIANLQTPPIPPAIPIAASPPDSPRIASGSESEGSPGGSGYGEGGLGSAGSDTQEKMDTPPLAQTVASPEDSPRTASGSESEGSPGGSGYGEGGLGSSSSSIATPLPEKTETSFTPASQAPAINPPSSPELQATNTPPTPRSNPLTKQSSDLKLKLPIIDRTHETSAEWQSYSLGQIVSDFILPCVAQLNGLHSHATPIAHNDLKPGNMQWDKEKKHFVLCDVGLAQEDGMLITLTGELQYAPPEILNNTAKTPFASDHHMDLFTLGLIIGEFLGCTNSITERHMIFQANQNKSTTERREALAKVKITFEDMNMNIPGLSKIQADQIKQFLYKLTDNNPKNRPSAAETRVFFQKFCSDLEYTQFANRQQEVANKYFNNEHKKIFLQQFPFLKEQKEDVVKGKNKLGL